MDPWEQVQADRVSYADYLETLSPDEWEADSLCPGWTVKGVTAHLLVIPMMSKGQVFFAFLRTGFNLDKMSARFVTDLTARMSTDEMVAQTRDTAGVRRAPPGLKPMGVLGEVLTHTSDVSRALGRPLDLPVEHYVMGLDYMKDVQPVLGCKERIAGLHLEATDADWSTGEGPLVTGPAQAMLLAMTGRSAALADLTGDGVAILQSR
jgi:uncharacterized protein (TIGR03083 family)